MTKSSSISKLSAFLLIFVLLFSALPMGEASAADIFNEPFDDSSQFTTSTPFFSDGYGDYFGLTDGLTGDFDGGAIPSFLKPYTGFTGSFLTGMDLDGEGATLPITVEWIGINISGVSPLAFSGDFAEFFDDPGDIDVPDLILVEYQIDGGGFQNLLQFVGADFTNPPYNGFLREDTDFDGTGDGLTLGNEAQTFEKLILGSGTTLDLRLTVFVDSGDEDFGVDNFSIHTAEVTVPDVLINEVDADTPGDDALEFIELYDGGTGNTSLDGLVVVLFNGSDDQSYTPVFDLDGYTTNADGYFVIGTLVEADLYVAPSTYGWLQNGADAVVLYSGDAVDFPNDTPVTTDNLLDAIVYDTSDSDDAGLLVLLNAEQPQVNEGGLGDKDNHSNQRCPNGVGDARNTDTYTQFIATPGTPNCEEPPPPAEACGDPFTSIYTIQGNGLLSPLDGTEVSTEGIVTGDLQDGKYGFTIQDAFGDGDAATSDGIFIYYTGLDVSVGDHVRVRGLVDEYYDLTEITGVSNVWPCSTGNSVAPTPLSLPLTNTSDLEAYEGMLVSFSQTLYISEYYAFSQFGEIVLSTDRQFQPTATFDPGSVDAAQLLADNLLNRIKLDDGRGSQNPDPALHPNGSIFDLTNLFRGGDVLDNVTGIVDYNYGEYKIHLTMGADYTSANPRTAQPDDVGGDLTIASFNVLNYFTTLDDGTNDICGPSGDMECRGADTAEEFERQRAKIVAALAAIDADVVGLIEIENNEFEAVADLVAGLNDAVGAGTYGYVDTGYIGGDAIKVAFIYKTETASLVGEYAVLDDQSFTNPLGYVDDDGNLVEKSRPALAQTFMDNDTGGIFTAVVNHLKSKGSPCGDGDDDPEQASCNLTRTLGAEALVDWLTTDPTNSGDADFLIMGDLNAYDKEDPIDAILAGGYSDLVYQFVGKNAYSYVFDGQLGYLDHALANDALASEISGVTIWHINADEASLIDYDMSYKKDAQDELWLPDAYRSSDHDPVIIGMNICDEIAPAIDISLSLDVLWPANHKYVDVTATVLATDNFDVAPTIELLSVTSSEIDDTEGDGDGSFINDIVIVDDYNFKLRAERSATAKDGRTYTITYQVTDACGNSTIGAATVFVPFSQGKKK